MATLKISFQTHEDDVWLYGRTWFLEGGLEQNEVWFSSDWVQLKHYPGVKSVGVTSYPVSCARPI